jgi:hypothetical protein
MTEEGEEVDMYIDSIGSYVTTRLGPARVRLLPATPVVRLSP